MPASKASRTAARNSLASAKQGSRDKWFMQWKFRTRKKGMR